MVFENSFSVFVALLALYFCSVSGAVVVSWSLIFWVIRDFIMSWDRPACPPMALRSCSVSVPRLRVYANLPRGFWCADFSYVDVNGVIKTF